jgi:hypothetical protein
MSTELVRYAISDLDIIADRAEKSGLFGFTKSQIFTLMLVAESEGLHPIAALRRFHVIEGRPAMRADAMQAEFQRSGGRIEWIESTDKVCSAVFSHKDYQPKGLTITVSFEELDKSGVTGGKNGLKKNWRQFPRQMLRARCISEGVRAVNPSVVVGIYSPEEVQDFDPPRQVKAEVIQPAKAIERPQERHQPVANTVDELQEFADRVATSESTPANGNGHGPHPCDALLNDAVASTNKAFCDWCVKEGVEKPVEQLLHGPQLRHHLMKVAFERGVNQASFTTPSGKPNSQKITTYLREWYAKDAEQFVNLIAEYIDHLRETKAAELGIMSPVEDAEETTEEMTTT